MTSEARTAVHTTDLPHVPPAKLPEELTPVVSADGSGETFKRLLDFVGCVLILLMVLPLLLMLALLIRLDSPGPIIYASRRLGAAGQTFPCLKFRTMHLDAEERLRDLLASDDLLRMEYEVYHKLREDPRITRFGGILRATSLDELPQLLNVLLGHMSLVGPRPYLPREAHKMTNHLGVILAVRPGMTGYWQVAGRNASTFAERLDMDVHYVLNRSLRFDLSILLKTVMVVIQKTGA